MKIVLCTENPFVLLKNTVFTMKDSNFTSKMRLSIQENSIMYRKSVCIVKKHHFYKEKLKFYIETRFYIDENSIMYRKSVCIVKKTPFLQ